MRMDVSPKEAHTRNPNKSGKVLANARPFARPLAGPVKLENRKTT